MRIALDPKARSPLYRQLQDQVRYAISVGQLPPGAGLPSIRDLEARLGVNRNTVRQAYLALEAEGLVELRQGREARVAARPRPQSAGGRAPTRAARELARAMLQRAEAEGIDGVRFAECLAEAARGHDAAHPRCAFLECSARQADAFARFAEPLMRRRVIGIDLHDLRGGSGRLPASVRVVLTPHWHLAEARDLLSDDAAVHAVLVRLSDECERRLRSLDGRPIGLVVRDAESAAGFREIVAAHAPASTVTPVLADDMTTLRHLAARTRAIVYTPPCEEAVRVAARRTARLEELVFEPDPAELRQITTTAFPALTGASTA